ncbi:MAG: hypothetical protein AB7M12_06025 [Hyphomonadaceae bacterium]
MLHRAMGDDLAAVEIAGISFEKRRGPDKREGRRIFRAAAAQTGGRAQGAPTFWPFGFT